jgi:hypothetical protein
MSIIEILTVLRRSWQVVAAATGVALLIAIVYLHVAHYYWGVELEVAPVETGQGAGNGMGGNLSGLAAIAGINLGSSQGNATFLKYIEDIKSRDVADALATRPDITHILFASDWDEKTQQWRKPGSVVHAIISAIKGVIGFRNQEWHPPNGSDIQNYITDNIMITRGLQTPFVTLKIVVKDPKFGAHFLMALHGQIDNVLRQKALARTNSQISYLTKTLETVTVAEHRQALGQALLDQEKIRMSASSYLPFAAEPLGPPTRSAKPVSPRPVLVLGMAFFMGFLIGALVALGWNSWKGNYLQLWSSRAERGRSVPY